jgi:hypothetical protein
MISSPTYHSINPAKRFLRVLAQKYRSDLPEAKLWSKSLSPHGHIWKPEGNLGKNDQDDRGQDEHEQKGQGMTDDLQVRPPKY